jgi:hypothetical protein
MNAVLFASLIAISFWAGWPFWLHY